MNMEMVVFIWSFTLAIIPPLYTHISKRRFVRRPRPIEDDVKEAEMWRREIALKGGNDKLTIELKELEERNYRRVMEIAYLTQWEGLFCLILLSAVAFFVTGISVHSLLATVHRNHAVGPSETVQIITATGGIVVAIGSAIAAIIKAYALLIRARADMVRARLGFDMVPEPLEVADPQASQLPASSPPSQPDPSSPQG